MLRRFCAPAARRHSAIRRDNTARRTLRRLMLEPLETRQVLSTFLVTNPLDSGDGSLRQAIIDANANTGPDLISFNIPGSGVHTIQPLSALPTITDPVTIDGYSQPGASPNTLAIGDNAVLEIQLDGINLDGRSGLVVAGGDSTIRGLVIDRFKDGYGIDMLQSGGNTIAGNFIGPDPTGLIAPGNHQIVGVYVGPYFNTIGGATPDARNVISGNQGTDPTWEGEGIFFFGGFNGIVPSGGLVQGNYIGTDATGLHALPNSASGVVFSDIGGVQIGGTTPGAGNVISGNTNAGISVGYSTNTVIQGNLIGTDATGTVAVGNGTGVNGVAGAILVGGTAPGSGNVISGNRNAGINELVASTIQGNLIGTDITGTHALGNSVGISTIDQTLVGGTVPAARNVISGNANVGLELQSGGTNNIIEGNYIGTDVTGQLALGRQSTAGIFERDTNDVIGGTVPAAGNLMVGSNGAALRIEGAHGTIVQGNFIGTDVTGNQVLSGSTIDVRDNVTNVLIGGPAAGSRNVIAANVSISGPGTSGVIVQGNNIGLGADGISALAGSFGVQIVNGAFNNFVGGREAGAGNVITNVGTGVAISNFSAPVATGNTIVGNSIFNNRDLGIDLLSPTSSHWPDGVTPNDSGDADVGNNNLQNYPLLSSALSGASTHILGSLNSTPSTTFTLDFYANTAADPSGYGEGQRYLGSGTVTTDASGNVSFDSASFDSASFATPLGASSTGEFISATATDPAGNTSEFSLDIATVSPNHAPVASDDSFAVAVDAILTVGTPGVLVNDSDADHDPLSAALAAGPTHGAVILHSDGSFTYTPAGNYAGDDSFTYLDSDGQASSNVATVHIAIARAASSAMVTVSDATYDGNSHGGTAVVTGFGGLNQSLTVTYLGANNTTYGPSSVPPTNAGSYIASAAFDGDATHLASSDSQTFTIAMASSTTTVIAASGDYSGQVHVATAAVTGAGGLNQDLAVTYVGTNGTTYGPSLVPPIDAGSYRASGSFAGDANHFGSSGFADFQITPKDLDATGSTENTINIAKAGTITFALANVTGIVAGDGSVYDLFNGATFHLRVASTDYSVTSTATVLANGCIQISWRMTEELYDDLYAVLGGATPSNKTLTDFFVSGTSNDGNYEITQEVFSRIFQQGKVVFS